MPFTKSEQTGYYVLILVKNDLWSPSQNQNKRQTFFPGTASLIHLINPYR